MFFCEMQLWFPNGHAFSDYVLPALFPRKRMSPCHAGRILEKCWLVEKEGLCVIIVSVNKDYAGELRTLITTVGFCVIYLCNSGN